MSIELLFCMVLMSAIAVLAWSVGRNAGRDAGWTAGFKKGRDEGIAIGWNEHREECVARDRARRQRNGQFKARQTQPQTTQKP